LEWIPNYYYGGHPFGFLPEASRAEAFAPFVAARDAILGSIKAYSPLEHASPDDPPVFVTYPNQDKLPIKGESQTDPTHSAVLGLLLKARLAEVGVPCELRYRRDGLPGDASLQAALLKALAPPRR
jgi:hypothetical protein